MTPDEKSELYQAGYKAGKEHSKSSPETLKLISNMENTIVIMQTDLTYIKSDVTEMKESIKELPTKQDMELFGERIVDRVFKETDKRYATKLTEKVVYALVGAILLGFLYALFRFVFK